MRRFRKNLELAFNSRIILDAEFLELDAFGRKKIGSELC